MAVAENCVLDEDDNLGYRRRLKSTLGGPAMSEAAEEVIPPEIRTAFKKTITAEIDAAFDYSSPFPNTDDLGRYVYAKNRFACSPQARPQTALLPMPKH